MRTPQQIQGLQEEPAAASKPAQRAITAADALRDIMDIVKGMLGAQVGVTSANAPCSSSKLGAPFLGTCGSCSQ